MRTPATAPTTSVGKTEELTTSRVGILVASNGMAVVVDRGTAEYEIKTPEVLGKHPGLLKVIWDDDDNEDSEK